MIPSVHAHPALLGQLADLSRRDGTAVRPFLFSFGFFFFFFFFSFFFSFSKLFLFFSSSFAQVFFLVLSILFLKKKIVTAFINKVHHPPIAHVDVYSARGA